MIFNRVIEQIKINKQIKDSGGYNAIPWTSLPKFSSVLPGVMQKTYYLVTANSKVGKSQISDFMFVLEPYKFVNTFKDSGITLDIDYFILEMSKEEKILQYIAHFLYTDKNIRISPKKLLSMFKEKTLSNEIFNITKSMEMANKFENFESIIHLEDSISNPYGIYKKCKQDAEKNGQWIAKNGNKVSWDDLKKKDSDVYKYLSHYEPYNPKRYKIIIVDHTSLLSPEKSTGGTTFASMDNWSAVRALDLKKKYGFTIVDVQQQSADI